MADIKNKNKGKLVKVKSNKYMLFALMGVSVTCMVGGRVYSKLESNKIDKENGRGN